MGAITKRLAFGAIAFIAIGFAMSQFKESAKSNAPETPIKLTYPREEISSHARNLVRARSKDADSLKFQNEFIATPGVHCGEVNGKNSFGAYTGFKRFMASEKTLLMDDGGTGTFEQAWQKFCVSKESTPSGT